LTLSIIPIYNPAEIVYFCPLKMWKIKNIYYRNIYGVIATLVFHLIVVAILLVGQLRPLKKVQQEEVYIDLTPEFNKIDQKILEKEKEKQPEQASKSTQTANQGQLCSNRAVNEASKEVSRSKDPYFDKEYEAEIAAAKKLVGDVNKTLAQKIPKIGDIAMPEDNTTGKTPEQIKQSNFKGKSNIRYYLENRYHVRLPIPVYLAEGGGEVIVDIAVNRDGRVISANPRPNSEIKDLTILAYAQQAAEKTLFNPDSTAPEKEKGTITYLFVPQ
jgi:hypothetical protein